MNLRLTTSDGTAVAGLDYTNTVNNFLMADGQVTTNILVPAAVATTAPSSASVPATISVNPGGGGGVSVPSVSPLGYSCATPEAEAPAASCEDGVWELSFDEAGCIVWACLTADERG